MERRSNDLFKRLPAEAQIGEELAVLPSRSIVGLAGRMPEHPPHEAKIETVEQRAVVENPVPSHPQRIA